MSLSIYHFPLLYRLAMRVAYGAEYADRYALIADQFRQPAHVLEVCCGDLLLHEHLQRRGLLRSYTGLEMSSAMLARGQARGIDVRAFDVRAGGELPRAEIVVMQASLYQFHDMAEALLRRLWEAAERQLVIAEPVRNLSQSRNALLRWLAQLLSRTDDRVHTFRYTEQTLLDLYQHCQIPVSQVCRTKQGREMVVVSNK